MRTLARYAALYALAYVVFLLGTVLRGALL